MSKKTLAKKTSLSLLRLVISVLSFVFGLFKPSNFFFFIYRKWKKQVSGERLRKGVIFFEIGSLFVGLITAGIVLFLTEFLSLSAVLQGFITFLTVLLALRIFVLRYFSLPEFVVESDKRYARDFFPADNFDKPLLGFSKKGWFNLDLKDIYSKHLAIFGNPSEYRDGLNFLLMGTFLRDSKACVMALDAAAGGVDYGVLRKYEKNGLIVETESETVQKAISWLRTELDKRLTGERDSPEPLFVFLDEELSMSVLSERQDSTTLLIQKIAHFGRKVNILLVINAWPDKSFNDLRKLLPYFMTISFPGTSFINDRNSKAVTIPNYPDVAGVYLETGLVLVKFIKANLGSVIASLNSREGSSLTWKLAKKSLGTYKEPEIIGEVANGSPWLQNGV